MHQNLTSGNLYEVQLNIKFHEIMCIVLELGWLQFFCHITHRQTSFQKLTSWLLKIYKAAKKAEVKNFHENDIYAYRRKGKEIL